MEKKMLTGLSLSRCIKDIIDGVVKEEDVKIIIARTLARNSDEWHAIVCQYQNSCWQKDPIRAGEICFRLLNSGKITQPRLEGKAYESIKDGHWR